MIRRFSQGQGRVAPFGHGGGAVANALANATVAFGSTTVVPPDNTRITFGNIAHLTSGDIR